MIVKKTYYHHQFSISYSIKKGIIRYAELKIINIDNHTCSCVVCSSDTDLFLSDDVRPLATLEDTVFETESRGSVDAALCSSK